MREHAQDYPVLDDWHLGIAVIAHQRDRVARSAGRRYGQQLLVRRDDPVYPVEELRGKVQPLGRCGVIQESEVRGRIVYSRQTPPRSGSSPRAIWSKAWRT